MGRNNDREGIMEEMIALRVDRAFKHRLEQAAILDGRSLSNWMRHVLNQELKKQEEERRNGES